MEELPVEITEKKITFLQQQILHWKQDNVADFPWRHTTNRWHALVAEIMLQRTRAEQVEPVYMWFAEKYENPSDYVQDEDSQVFDSLGLVWRQKYLKELAIILSKQSEIPSEKDALLRLPGVGHYIAAAYRSLHLGIRDVIIDSNVVRLYGRYFGFATHGETRRRKWFREMADAITPENEFRDFNYGLIDFTREICKPMPLQEVCPLNSMCVHYSEGARYNSSAY